MASAAVPAEQWRLAAALGFHAGADLPASRLAGSARGTRGAREPCLPAVLQELRHRAGARRRAGRATLEVAIYEALKIDLDFRPRRLAGAYPARDLPLADRSCCIGVHAAARRRTPVDRPCRGPTAAHRGLKVLDGVVLALALLSWCRRSLSIADRRRATSPTSSTPISLRAFATSCRLPSLRRGHRLRAGPRAGSGRPATSARRAVRAARRVSTTCCPIMLLAVPPFALTAGLFLMIRRFVDPAMAGSSCCR